MQKYKLLIWIFVLLLITGCSEEYQSKVKDFKTKISGKEVVQEQNFTCPVQECIQNDLNRAGAFFTSQEIRSQYLNLISISNSFLYCSFIAIEDAEIANAIIVRSKTTTDVKIFLDSASTMDFCDTTCIPKLQSQYNNMFAEGVNIHIGPMHTNYCVNENGVLLSTYIPDAIQRKDSSLYVDSKSIVEAYKGEFLERYE